MEAYVAKTTMVHSNTKTVTRPILLSWEWNSGEAEQADEATVIFRSRAELLLGLLQTNGRKREQLVSSRDGSLTPQAQ